MSDFPNLSILFPYPMFGTAEHRFAIPERRFDNQTAFFSPVDGGVPLDAGNLLAYSKRFLSSCARISADESDGCFKRISR